MADFFCAIHHSLKRYSDFSETVVIRQNVKFFAMRRKSRVAVAVGEAQDLLESPLQSTGQKSYKVSRNGGNITGNSMSCCIGALPA